MRSARSPGLPVPPDVPTPPAPSTVRWSSVSHKPLRVAPVSPSNPSARVHHAGQTSQVVLQSVISASPPPKPTPESHFATAEDTGKLQALESWLASFFFFFFASADLWGFIGSGNASESFLGVPRGQSAGRVGVLEAAAVPFG